MNISQSHILKGKRIILLFILAFMLVPNVKSQDSTQPRGKLVITITSIRSDIGQIAMGLYDDENQWVYKPKYNYKWAKNSLLNRSLTVKIDSLPYGSYACTILDDENCDLDMNFRLGLPLEGWGMSNNPPFLKLKAPPFDECSVKLDSQEQRFSIKMNYLRPGKKVRE